MRIMLPHIRDALAIYPQRCPPLLVHFNKRSVNKYFPLHIYVLTAQPGATKHDHNCESIDRFCVFIYTTHKQQKHTHSIRCAHPTCTFCYAQCTRKRHTISACTCPMLYIHSHAENTPHIYRVCVRKSVHIFIINRCVMSTLRLSYITHIVRFSVICVHVRHVCLSLL